MPPVKIFIDSALRVDGSDTNFTYSLPRPIPVETPQKAMVDQIHIPHTFATINANNRALYVGEVNGALDVETKVLLDLGNYDGTTLATEVMNKLNAQNNLTWTVVYDTPQQKLKFSVAAGYGYIYPMGWLLKHPASHNFAVVDHDDAGHIIGVHGSGNSDVLTCQQTPIMGKHISVIPYHTLFLHCDQGLGALDSAIGLQGNGSVLRSIPVTTSYGQMLHDLSLNPFDHTVLYRGQIGQFKFRLADRYGRDVILDQPICFSILLTPVDEFET